MENPDQPQYRPHPEQPQYQPQPEQPQAPVPQIDPGKTLGIVGFIFAFVGLQLVGLILSILGFNNSKKAGFKNTLAFVGIILNAIFLVLGIAIVAFIVIATVSYSGVTQRANTSSSQATAATVVKHAELYYADNGTYPKLLSDLNTDTNIESGKILFEPATPTTIEFYSCNETGNKIGYFDYTEKEILFMYAGEANSTTNCILAIN